ncbi:hypothetical protein B0T16DRAFT_453834 [Cercophora newfieldiana]|uniref:Uncharacterized protein n=1 Tax=Cercophora newfieldiana TaxID=92897 RepID=A0AA39YH02_9PEZI|nr:hypothetical protein B0T16DRAFT_453834 [Cercophora newfieldiana]
MATEKSTSRSWGEEEYRNLCVALTVALTVEGASFHRHKDTIMGVMEAHGHTLTWEAIRKMPAHWREEKLQAFAWALFEAAKPHSAGFKDDVLARMEADGYYVNWDQLR